MSFYSLCLSLLFFFSRLTVLSFIRILTIFYIFPFLLFIFVLNIYKLQLRVMAFSLFVNKLDSDSDLWSLTVGKDVMGD